MKTIYAAVDPHNFFRLDIDDNSLKEIATAQKWIKDCPYDGILWIYMYAHHLNWNSALPCKIEIAPTYVNPVVTTWEDEYLLEWEDDLLKIPDVYLTRKFRVLQEDAKKYLSRHDEELVTTWEKFHKKILEN